MKKAFIIIILTAVSLVFFPLKVYAETPRLLKDLDVTNGYMINFDKDTFTYTVELYVGESTPGVIAVPYDEDCTVQIEGDSEKIPPGSSNTVTVSVYDTQGNFATYTLKVYAQAENGGLSFLRCLNGTMSPQYRDTARNFYIILPNDCTSAELDIRTWDENAHVEVTGNENMEEGKRKKAFITVTDTDGKVSEYELYIYRQRKIESNINPSYMLSSIQINSGKVPIEFEQTKGSYRIKVPKSVTELDIFATAEDRVNIVEIAGSDVVTDYGFTTVTITVSNPDDDTNEKSIYVLEFYHDSFTKMPKYTSFQLTAVFASSVLLSFIIFIFVHLFILQRVKKQSSNAQVENDSETTQDENNI